MGISSLYLLSHYEAKTRGITIIHLQELDAYKEMEQTEVGHFKCIYQILIQTQHQVSTTISDNQIISI
jgi:hypothetical protein